MYDFPFVFFVLIITIKYIVQIDSSIKLLIHIIKDWWSNGYLFIPLLQFLPVFPQPDKLRLSKLVIEKWRHFLIFKEILKEVPAILFSSFGISCMISIFSSQSSMVKIFKNLLFIGFIRACCPHTCSEAVSSCSKKTITQTIGKIILLQILYVTVVQWLETSSNK